MSERNSGTPLPQPARLAPWQRLLLGAALAYAFLARAAELDSSPFTVDEAEMGINALTILEHGLPVDHYLGQPIYENTLLQPWPESAEYEFKDSSYSGRGLAVYHGWLPLYATAASFALAGVGPDRDPSAVRVRHSGEEVRHRTAAGRLPAALFGVVFLLFVFCAARAWYGSDAAWAALAAGVVCKPVVYFASQARYYAPTLALTAGCAFLLARIVRRGRWRDFLPGAALFVLLFHTHLLSFVSACVAFGLTVPFWARRPGSARKLAVFAAVVAAGVFPWLTLTGFVGSTRSLPLVLPLLGWKDVRGMLHLFGPFALAAALTLAWVAAAPLLRRGLPARCLDPFVGRGKVFLFLAGWAAVGLTIFITCVPAPSFFYGRLVLTILVPGFLFGALLCAGVARAVTPRFASLAAAALFVAVVALSGQATLWGRAGYDEPSSAFDVVEHLRGLDLRPGTRIYATPNHHLILTFYTGLPVQSVAPVRQAYLDGYPGDLLIVEAGPRYDTLSPEEVQWVLAADGPPPTEAEAWRMDQLLTTRLLCEELRGCVTQVAPTLGPAPPRLGELLAYQRRKTAQGIARRLEEEGNPMFTGYHLPDHSRYWQVFYYRFVNPEMRSGDNLNYGGRLRDARATVLPQGWVFYHCPARIASPP
jgi:uncharacterized membrane protein